MCFLKSVTKEQNKLTASEQEVTKNSHKYVTNKCPINGQKVATNSRRAKGVGDTGCTLLNNRISESCKKGVMCTM